MNGRSWEDKRAMKDVTLCVLDGSGRTKDGKVFNGGNYGLPDSKNFLVPVRYLDKDHRI